ncbi:hypothetical protein ACFL2T_02780 [Elusimicrobiota bacterium]
MSALHLLIIGAVLTSSGSLALFKLDPPRQEGESRFEGVLPNRRGLLISAAYLALILGLILLVMGAAGLYYG